jgi:hypothetical protein
MRKMLFVCSSIILVLNLILPVNTIVAQETTKTAQQDQAFVSSLSNEDVLKMVEAGLSMEIIEAKIKASECNFDTTLDALQKLKTAGVSEAVILAMVQAPVGLSSDAIPAQQSRVARGEVIVRDGTPLVVELMSRISSNTAKVGDVVDLMIVNPVVVNGVVVIEKGAPAKARIGRAKKAGFWGRAGRVSWTMMDVLLVDGNRTPIRMEKQLTGESKGGTVFAGVVVTALVLWPATPFWGFKKGKDAVFPEGTHFHAFVHGDVVVMLKPDAAPQTRVNVK